MFTSTNAIIEMDDLSRHRAKTPLDGGRDAGTHAATDDGSVSVWAWTSAVVLALFSTCLLVFPRLLLFLAEPADGRGSLTSLERYLAHQLGVVLGTLAITIVAVLPNEWPTGLQQRSGPSWHPLMIPVTAASLFMALLSYDNRNVGTLATTVFWGSGVVGLLGLWMVVFPGPPPISRKTGADEHTSSFIFGNKSAASSKKKLWKKNQSK